MLTVKGLLQHGLPMSALLVQYCVLSCCINSVKKHCTWNYRARKSVHSISVLAHISTHDLPVQKYFYRSKNLRNSDLWWAYAHHDHLLPLVSSTKTTTDNIINVPVNAPLTFQ